MQKEKLRYIAGIFLLLFGLVTLFMSSAVLFDWLGIRAKQGNYVPFIVWTNWICGFLYLFAAYGFLKLKRWTLLILKFAAAILILALIGLGFYICADGVYETKTVVAMSFRIVVTILCARAARATLNAGK